MLQRIFIMSELYSEEGFSPDGAEVLDFSALGGTNCYCDDESHRKISSEICPGPRLNWIDSGDFHYLSALTTGIVDKPFELVLFDHHTDRQRPEFGMLSCGGWVSWAEEHNPCLKHTVSIGPGENPEPYMKHLPVYLSIDLDVLDVCDFRTNWDQGTMRLHELEDGIIAATAGRRLLGVDVCGGITRAKGALDCDLAANLAVRNQIMSIFVNL